MNPVQDYLSKQLYKGYAKCKMRLTGNNPRKDKSIKAACNAPRYSLAQ
ncbi:hypothetical protein [Bacteriophage sp.]|nr:hypothetical protein [Bacteriophage sp.]